MSHVNDECQLLSTLQNTVAAFIVTAELLSARNTTFNLSRDYVRSSLVSLLDLYYVTTVYEL